MLLSVLLGGAIGFITAFFDFASFGGAISGFLGMIQKNLLAVQVCIGLPMLATGEFVIPPVTPWISLLRQVNPRTYFS